MVTRKKSPRAVSVYANLAAKRRDAKDVKSRKKAEYLATLPKEPLQRLLYRLHPKRVANYWFSKQGALMALKIVGVGILVMILLVGALFAFYRKDLDAIRPGSLAQRVKTTVTTYYDRNGAVLWEDKGEGDYTLVVEGKDIAPCMAKATVAIEDKDFYKHQGVSVTGVVRALLSNAHGNSTQGGSTLTQQLVKQVFFADQAQERGLAGIPRKIKEMILAIEVERMYSKEQIINLYLNESPYGGRRNGVESAAQTYFHKPAKNLSLPECAMLAAIPNQPGLYDPYNIDGHAALTEREHKVLDNMVDMKYITKKEADDAKKTAIIDTVYPMADQLANIKAPHFVLMVRNQLEKSLGKTIVGNGGLTVKTTLDKELQDKLEQNMTAMFDGSMTNRDCGYANCADYAGFSNGAAAIEDVKTGQLLAMVGSRDYNYPGYGQDNAATAFIQPGSSIKPLVYAQLFQNQGAGKTNYGSGSILSDTKTSFGGGPTPYTPQNADGSFQNNITIRQALDRSRNIPAIKAMAVNEANAQGSTWKTIRDLGDKDYCTIGADATAGLSSAIGGCGTRLTDHVNAISSLARMGVYMPQSTILSVSNSNGQVLKKYTSETKQVIDPQAAFIVNDILGDSNARAGLGWNQDYLPNMNALRTKVAAKTGTSNGEVRGKVVPKDIWTVGYTPTLAMAVWLGNPDTTPLTKGNSLIPAMFFDKTMAAATKLYVVKGAAKYDDWFAAPAGIQKIGNEVYPSYYNKSMGATTAKITFDRVSKKKATDCTPAGARIDIGVTKVMDPVSKKESVSASEGYIANEEDDAHSCNDAKPTVTISVQGKEANITYNSGKFTLQTIDVSINGNTIASKSISSSDTWKVPLTEKGTVTATVTDEGYYTASDQDKY